MYSQSGIGTYLREILPYILKEKYEFLLIGDKDKIGHLEYENIEILHCKIPIFSVKEAIGFPVKKINECDRFYTPNYNIPWGIKIPIFPTIHDVVFLDMPEITNSYIGFKIRKLFLKRAVKISEVIFTVSNFSKSRIEKHFKFEKEILVAGNGISRQIIDYPSNPESENIGKKNPYIVYVGNIKKHKGLGVLLKAFKIALQKGFDKKLVIVGKSENFRTKDDEILRELNNLKENEIIFTGYVSDEELIKWLVNADALIQPSLYEGFGIPPLEALFLGTKVIVSDIAVFREVYSDLPVKYFKTADSEDLSNKLIELFFNSIIRLNIREKMLSKYSYEDTAKKIINGIMREEVKI
jgi:glycosyltransferase involved in cell wall biosynthesis